MLQISSGVSARTPAGATFQLVRKERTVLSFDNVFPVTYLNVSVTNLYCSVVITKLSWGNSIFFLVVMGKHLLKLVLKLGTYTDLHVKLNVGTVWCIPVCFLLGFCLVSGVSQPCFFLSFFFSSCFHLENFLHSSKEQNSFRSNYFSLNQKTMRNKVSK